MIFTDTQKPKGEWCRFFDDDHWIKFDVVYNRYIASYSRLTLFNEKVNKSFSRLSFTSERTLTIKKDSEIIALVAEQLRANFLFLSLEDAQIIELARKFELAEYGPGSTIIEQGRLHYRWPTQI